MSTDLSKPAGGDLMQVPAFLQEVRGTGVAKGTEGLREYWVPPRLKVIQGMTAPEIKAIFGEGSVIVTPFNVPVAPMTNVQGQGLVATPFTFIPILQFAEWGVVNPKVEGLPFFRERSNDRNSEIAKRANDFKTPGVREVDCPEAPGKKIRYCEFINFLCVVENVPELRDMPVLFSFWSTGHKDGRMLANLIMARAGMSMFAMRFQGQVVPRKGNGNNWWGLSVTTPMTAPAFVQSREEYDKYEQMYDRFDAMRRSGEMQAEYDDDTDSTVAADYRDVSDVDASDKGEF